jgi:hypothetical protein
MSCHGCGSFSHRLSNCPGKHRYENSRRSRGNCYVCQSSSHYSTECPNRRNVTQRAVTCYKCGENGHYSDRCSREEKEWIPQTIPSFLIKFGERWAPSNSYLLDANTPLFRLKKAVQDELFELGMWSRDPQSRDGDPGNKTPHVQMRTSDEPETLLQLRLNNINNSEIKLTSKNVSIQQNTIQVDVGMGRHYTLAYRKDLGSGFENKQICKTAILRAIDSVDNARLEIVNETVEIASPPDDRFQCRICFDSQYETVLQPCRHMCMCKSCADQISRGTNKCPICRTRIASIDDVFVA